VPGVVIALAAGAAACGGDDGREDAAGPAVLVAFAPNETARSEPSTAVRLIDLATNERRDIGEPAYYQTVRFSPDGRYIATVGSDLADGADWVRVYDVASGEQVATDAGLSSLAGISWSPRSAVLAVVSEQSVAFLTGGEEPELLDGVGAAEGANPLRWGWTSDGAYFGLIADQGLVFIDAADPGARITVPTSDFPGLGTDWAVRTTGEPGELGLVDLQPVAGIAEGRAEYPIMVKNGTVIAGEPRIVSIYDWNTLPTPEFDAATDQQFPIVRKTCSPCRSADGGSSLFIIWVNDSIASPPSEGADWPEGTRTFLAIELGPEDATAVDLGVAPEGAIDVAGSRPVYDVVNLRP